MRKYYFRVDGGNIYSIATGHIVRCLKLAEYIAHREQTGIYFIMKNYAEGIDLVKNKFEVLPLDRNIEKKKEIDILHNIIDAGSYFICDLRDIDDNYIREIKKKCTAFILFDDLGIKKMHPDILINPTPFCYDGYNKSEYPETTLLLGEKFFFIRPDFVNKSYIRDFQKEKYSVIASFGGADPLNITEFFIQTISPRLSAHNISVVLGTAYAKKDEVIEKYKGRRNIRFFTQVFPLDGMFLSHDIAFVCAGDTCIEACRSGIATFIISSIYYEKKFGQLLHEKGMACFVADIEDIKGGKFLHKYLSVFENREMLMRLSRCGMTLIDGEGLERIYRFIWEETNEHKRNGIYTN